MLAVGSAAAQSPGSLEYVAPASCPGREAWLDRVLSRLDDGASGWSRERLEAVAAGVQVNAAGTAARVVFHEGGIERSIEGADCDEVTSAAALILAIALGAGHSEVAAPPRAAAPVDARIDAPAPAASSSERRHWGLGIGASAEANGWTGPWPAGVLGVSVEALAPSRGWSLRAVGTYGSSEQAVDGRRAEFTYWGGHLDLCPVAVGSRAAWRWTSCAELHAGLLQASGDANSALATGSSRQALLATAIAAMRVETPPLWAVRLQLETGLAVPLVRQTFQFGAPEQVMFESPAVGFLGRAGIQVPLDGQHD
ncbi:MAG TPA: hypothetical protein VMG12_35485 [Polyangiaceae bacterium]|nr:hypothetical protein [Polyangiaceae bacterium]